jgi:hypothetical protein
VNAPDGRQRSLNPQSPVSEATDFKHFLALRAILDKSWGDPNFVTAAKTIPHADCPHQSGESLFQ